MQVVSTFVGLLLVDRWGRRPLLLQGGVQMLVSQARAAAEAMPLGTVCSRVCYHTLLRL
jgi:hypothetical protein